MDYTIIGNEVNLAARLQSHAELGGILLAHETASLIKDTILTEEQKPVSAKGFAHLVRVYRVVGVYDELENDGRIIREERDGFRLLLDLTKGNQASAQSQSYDSAYPRGDRPESGIERIGGEPSVESVPSAIAAVENLLARLRGLIRHCRLSNCHVPGRASGRV